MSKIKFRFPEDKLLPHMVLHPEIQAGGSFTLIASKEEEMRRIIISIDKTGRIVFYPDHIKELGLSGPMNIREALIQNLEKQNDK